MIEKNDINELDISSIKFIFAKPYSIGYWLYSINNIESLVIIPKENLIEIIEKKLKFRSEDLEYVFTRSLPFIYDNENRVVKRFSITNNAPTKKELASNLKKEMTESATLFYKNNNNYSNNSRYNSFFNNFSLLKY